MNEEQIRELLRGMRDEAPPPEVFARVRQRVADRTSRPDRRWLWALVPAALAVTMVWILVPPRRESAPAIRRPVAQVEPPPPAPPPMRAAEPRRVQTALRKPVRRAPQTAPAALIRIETSDPDVVILLVAGDL